MIYTKIQASHLAHIFGPPTARQRNAIQWQIHALITASTHRRATNGPPAIRHSMANRLRAAGGPLLCVSWDIAKLDICSCKFKEWLKWHFSTWHGANAFESYVAWKIVSDDICTSCRIAKSSAESRGRITCGMILEIYVVITQVLWSFKSA